MSRLLPTSRLLGAPAPAPALASVAACDDVLADWAEAARSDADSARPFVTLSYAQSLDGCIAAEPGKPSAISGPASLRLTHALRARHDAILIGIGTLLADDPRLDVRLVDGPSPRPVVVDSRLACPVTARLLQREARVLFASTQPSRDKQRALEARGAEVWELPAWSSPTRPAGSSEGESWVDLALLLARLRDAGMRRVMVEGGARILTSFLWAGLADYAVITLAPQWLGGLSAVDAPHGRDLRALAGRRLPRLARTLTSRLGEDMIIAGALTFEGERA